MQFIGIIFLFFIFFFWMDPPLPPCAGGGHAPTLCQRSTEIAESVRSARAHRAIQSCTEWHRVYQELHRVAQKTQSHPELRGDYRDEQRCTQMSRELQRRPEIKESSRVARRRAETNKDTQRCTEMSRELQTRPERPRAAQNGRTPPPPLNKIGNIPTRRAGCPAVRLLPLLAGARCQRAPAGGSGGWAGVGPAEARRCVRRQGSR